MKEKPARRRIYSPPTAEVYVCSPWLERLQEEGPGLLRYLEGMRLIEVLKLIISRKEEDNEE